MSDVQFPGSGNCRDRLNVSIRQAVSKVELQTALARKAARPLKLSQFKSLRGRRNRIGIATGVQFNRRAAKGFRRLNLILRRINEETDNHACRVQLIDTTTNSVQIAHDIQAPFGRHLLPLLGNQCHLLRKNFEREVRNGLFGSHLKIELHLYGLLENADIAILDVPTIFPQMNGDDVGTAEFGLCRRPNGIGLDRSPGLSQVGDVVDVDSECGHIRFAIK